MTFERILSHFQVRKRGIGKAQCMDGIRELNELEGQLETEKQESEDKI